jgi:Ni/Fe-hydrogenase subunit HybB-like protein
MVVLGILAVLTVLGLATGIYRLVVGLGATTDLSDQYAWGLWLGFDFGLIAFGGAAFTLALVVHVLNLKKYEVVLRPALLTGFLGYISVLVILLLDLGRPDRFWGFIVFPNIHSPLFEVSWCILLYTIVLTLEIAPVVLERMNKSALAHTLHKAVIPVTIAGVTLSTLHQSTLGTMYLALPGRTHALWWSWLLPLLYYLSAIGMGLSATILVMLIGSKAVGREPETGVLAGLGKGSVWVWIVYLVLRFGDLLFTGDLGAVFAFDSKSILFWVEILLMAVTPIVLYSMEGVRKTKSGLFWTALITTVGLFFNRFNAMFSGSPVPVGASHVEFGYFPTWIEFAVQFGVLAGAALVWYLAARFLPVFQETVEEAH